MQHPTPHARQPTIRLFTALWKAHRRRMLDLAFRMLLDCPATPRTWCRKRSPAWPARTSPHRRSRGMAGGRHQQAVPRPAPHPTAASDRRARRRSTIPSTRDAPDPSSQVTLVDNVTLAMHALLERLSPAERTSFVLHDVFQYPFEEVATIVGRSPASCRQLASRARRTPEGRVRARPVLG